VEREVVQRENGGGGGGVCWWYIFDWELKLWVCVTGNGLRV
jgi:hypothetical protein